MKQLKIVPNKISSLELVKQINVFRNEIEGKKELKHKTLLEIIRDEFSDEINEQKILPVKYKDKKGEERPMFNLTLSQAKQVLVRESKAVRKATIKYIEELEAQQPIQAKVSSSDEFKLLNAKARLENAKTRKAAMYLKLSNVDTLSTEYQNILVAQAVEVMSGEKLLPHVKSEQKTYSATELGEMFSISAQKLGAITNKHNLKTDEYGEWYRDKSPYSSKEVDSFRYYDAVIPRLEKILI